MTDAPALKPILLNGLRLACPACGVGELFKSYLKRRDACPHCGESFAGLDADDGPAWLTIVVALHICVPLLILLEDYGTLGDYAQFAIVVVVMVVLVLALLPRAKGLFISILWWNARKKA
ncbi:MAG: DUF983 domain-containing protein [Methylocystis sp.]